MDAIYNFAQAIWYVPHDNEIDTTSYTAPGQASTENNVRHEHNLRRTLSLKKPRRLISSPTNTHRPPPRTPTPTSAKRVGRSCPHCGAKVRVNVKTGAITKAPKRAKPESPSWRTKWLPWYYEVAGNAPMEEAGVVDITKPRTLRSGWSVEYV